MSPGIHRAVAVAAVLSALTLVQAQAPPDAVFTLVSREGQRPLPATLVDGQELVALDDVAALFQATLSEDALTGGVSLAFRGQTIVASANQATVSVGGRVIALPAPIIRSGPRWLAPVEILQSALGQIYERRILVRRASRLVLIGDVRVPRVTVRVGPSGPPTRVTIEAMSPAAGLTATVDGGRVTVRVDADALDLSQPLGTGGLVTQIRAGDQPNTLVVLLEPGAGPARTVTQTTSAITRLTIDIPAAAGAASTSLEAGLPGADSPFTAPDAGVNAATLFAPRPVLQTVVIDPGHGGDDAGARGRSGLLEKQLTIDVALRLRALLENRLGVRVVLTRNGDLPVGPDARVATANTNKADLFLSLHANTAPTPAAAGAEVAYARLDPEGERARAEAARTAVLLPVLGGGTRGIDIIPWDLAQARHVEASAAFAALIAEELALRVPMGPSPVRQAPLRLLEGLNMPAALIEMAYLTNPAQDALAASDDFRNAVAEALYDAVVRVRRQLEERQTP